LVDLVCELGELKAWSCSRVRPVVTLIGVDPFWLSKPT